MRIVVAVTGATGALYTQRLLDHLDPRAHEIHLVFSRYAHQVIAEELPGGLRLPAGAVTHNLKSMNAPFASGSNAFDAMVVIPCTMGTLGAIAQGQSRNLIHRAAEVTLKEGRPLILVVRETPLSLVHLRNMLAAAEAGATIFPAMPGFYQRPRSLGEMARNFVGRLLDHLGVEHELLARWGEKQGEEAPSPR